MSIQQATDCDCPIFNSSCFIGGSDSFTSSQLTYLSSNFLKYPTAQGDNILLNVVANEITVSQTLYVDEIQSANSLDISTTGLTFNNIAGTAGQLLTSQGAGVIPTWSDSPPSITYQTGTITPLATSGSVVFSPAFSVIPKVVLTVDGGTGATNIVVSGLAGVSTSGFNWLISSTTGVSKVNWFAYL